MKTNQRRPQIMEIGERKQKLFELLTTHNRCTFAYLANELGVSKRTVKRYLDELELTVPLKFTVGRYNGGVELDTRLKRSTAFNKPEFLVIEKVISETEQTGICQLNDTELKILKRMIAYNS